MNILNYLKLEKTVETIKTYNLGEWNDIYDIKRTLEALLKQFKDSYKENDINTIKNILLTRIVNLSVTLEVLNSLPADVFTVDQVFIELEIRKNSVMYNYLEVELSEKFKKGIRINLRIFKCLK